MKHTIIIALLIWFNAAVAQNANEPKKFSLKEAVAFAKQNNPDLKNRKLEVEAAQKTVKEVLSNGLPQVNASGSFNNSIQIPTQVMPNFLKPVFLQAGLPGAQNMDDYIAAQFGQKFTTTGSITASQLIFDGGFLMGVKASREFVNLSRLNVERNEIETEVNVSKAYYMALLLNTNAKMMEVNIATLTKTQSDMEQLYKNGMIEKTESDRLTLQLSNLKLAQDKIKDQSVVMEMLLKLQMGMSINEPIALTDNLENLFKAEVALALGDKSVYENRVEYRLLQQQKRLNEMNKKRYQYSYAPNLAAFVNHQQNTFGQSFSELGKTWYPGTTWGLSLNVPVFDGLKKSAQIQQARIDVKKTENDIQMLENAIDQQLFQHRMSAQRSVEQLKIQEKNMQLAEEIYQHTKIKYDNGMGSSLELTVSQNDLETARTNYLATMYEYFVAQLELKKAAGIIK